MSPERPATSARASLPDGPAAATLQWPPSSEDLAAIACVETTQAVASVCLRAAADAPARAVPRRVTSRRPAIARTAELDLVWPPPAVDVDTVVALRLDNVSPRVDRSAPRTESRRRRSWASSPVGRIALGAGAAGALALPLFLQSVDRPSPASHEPVRPDVVVAAGGPGTHTDTSDRAPAMTSGEHAPVRLPQTPPAQPSGIVVQRLAEAAPVLDPAGTSARVVASSRLDAPVAVPASLSVSSPRDIRNDTPAVPAVPRTLRASASLAGDISGAVAVPFDAPRAPMPKSIDEARPEASVTPSRPAVATATPLAEEPAVRAVLQQYGAAYTRLDAAAARAIWPSVDARALGRAFGALQSQQLVFDRCEVSVEGRQARAACLGSSTYVPRVGDRSPRTQPRHWTFRLEKAGDDRWQIAAAESAAR